jgi:hypothetical protein
LGTVKIINWQIYRALGNNLYCSPLRYVYMYLVPRFGMYTSRAECETILSDIFSKNHVFAEKDTPRHDTCPVKRIKCFSKKMTLEREIGHLTFGLFVECETILCDIFSSPEHLCSWWAFRIALCPSCVVNFCFKQHLLLSPWAKVDETCHRCSLHEALPKLFKEIISMKNSGCHGNQKTLKIFLSETARPRA